MAASKKHVTENLCYHGRQSHAKRLPTRLQNTASEQLTGCQTPSSGSDAILQPRQSHGAGLHPGVLSKRPTVGSTAELLTDYFSSASNTSAMLERSLACSGSYFSGGRNFGSYFFAGGGSFTSVPKPDLLFSPY